jgi:hypothetical protein
MIITDLFSSKDACPVCGQTPCNCTHIAEEKVRLDPKCWSGKKIGNPKTKMKGGVRVNNCVPAESVAENYDNGEYSDEAGMAHGNLITIAKAARGLLDTIDQHEDLPEWVQEKIAKVEGMLVSAWNYLQSQEAQGIDPRVSEMYANLAENWQRVSHRLELNQEFDLIESIVESIADRNGVDAEAVWADLESLTEDELYVFAVTSEPIMEDWQKANKKDKTDGMSRKAVKAYRREHPGSKLQTAVTTKPSKLKKGSKASKRRKSYCSRSRGQMKMHNISCAKTPDKAICKARRRWNCEGVDRSDLTVVAEASPEATFNALKGLKSWQVVIMNNYYRGKYSDYSGRYFYVLATSPEEAKQVVLDNADAILKDLLAMKAHNGRSILPRNHAVRITADRIGRIEDGTEHGRLSTSGFKKMYSPQGVMMVKLNNGAIEDVQGQDVVQGSDLKTVAKADLGKNSLNLPAGYGDVVQPQKLKGVAEDDAGDIEQRMLVKIEKEKQRLAQLKKTDPEAYKREMAKRKTSSRIPPVSTFEQQGVAEGAGNIGPAIKSLYKKIYRAGDDEIEYFYNDSPVFAQYWDEYEGDLNSIIAEVDPAELQIIYDELKSYVDQANLAEGEVTRTPTGLVHKATDRYGAGDDEHLSTGGRSGFANPGKYARDLDHVNKQLVKDLDAGMGVTWKKNGREIEVDEVSDKTLIDYLNKVHADSQKHEKDPTKRSPEKASRSVGGFARAFNKLDARKEPVNEIDPNNYDSDEDYYRDLEAGRYQGVPKKPYNPDWDADDEEFMQKWYEKHGLEEQGGLGFGENDEKEADYGKSYQDMVKRMGAKAREQERSRPVDIGALARKLRDIEHKDSK